MTNMLLEENAGTESNLYSERRNIAFGWGKYRPKCLQFLNNPRWFMAVIVVYTLSQGSATLGLINFVMPSIERRFSFSSTELGIIAAANDISALLLVVFISFYGGYGNKIKWMGGGAIFIGSGLLLFSLPHFMVDRYQPVDARTTGLCLVTNTTINHGPQQCNVPSGGEWYYLIIFIAAQLIIGAGLSPFYSLLPAYLDENVHPKSLPVYLGIWYTFLFLGPGIGFLIGGRFSSIYVDIEQPAGSNLTPKHPSWIGAWWLGFLVFGFAMILCSVAFLGFPQEMPGAKERRLEHIRQGHIKDVEGEKKPRLRDILSDLKKLLKNRTFAFNALGLSAVLLYGPSVNVFISKIFRLKFGLDPVTSGYVISTLTVIGIGLSSLLGSIAVRMFSLKDTCKKAALMCFIMNVMTPFTALIFLVPGCVNTNLAGINSPYLNGISSGNIPTIPPMNDLPLQSQCNTNCHCSLENYFPICGTDFVTYFDACHAGCAVKLHNMTFTNCSCIPGTRTNPQKGGSAKAGYCDRKCKNIFVFAALASIAMVIQFSTAVPGRTVTLRCVPDNKRAFAGGIQFVIIKTLGLLPGPIIFGNLVDRSCRLWQDICGEKGRCFDYDIDNLSRTITFYGIATTCVTIVLYFLSWYYCEPQFETGGQSAKLMESSGADLKPPTNETRF